MKKPLFIGSIVALGLLAIYGATQYVDLAGIIMRMHGR
jgi:hypothetical protein